MLVSAVSTRTSCYDYKSVKKQLIHRSRLLRPFFAFPLFPRWQAACGQRLRRQPRVKTPRQIIARPMNAPASPASASSRPVIAFPPELPVSARRAEIEAALQKHQVIIVCGETGSGKTTQLPKMALALGRGRLNAQAGGRGRLIGHTQPRRIAATSVARRIADELQTPLGEVVGYKVRFSDRLSPGASVKLMTDGILLAERRYCRDVY